MNTNPAPLEEAYENRDNFDEDIYEDVSFVPMLQGKSEDGNDI